MNWIIDRLPEWNSWLAFLLYWLPLALCAYGYLVRSVRNYRMELERRATTKYYSPRETLGTLVGRFLATTTPGFNLCAAVFNVGPEVFGDFFRWIGQALDVPLVPARKDSTGTAPEAE